MSELSETKRALLDKYLRGEISDTSQAIVVEEVGINSTEPVVEGERERIVAIQSNGSKRPFFFLHGQWTGDAFYCYPLAQALGNDQPFYLLEPYQLEGLAIPPSLEEVASAHLRSLRKIQPEGPYVLGGWCNGALIVYEMARQLLADGQRIDVLVLMEPMSLTYVTHLRLFRNIIRFCGEMLCLDQGKQFDMYLRLKQGLKHSYRYLRYAHYRKSKEHWIPTAEVLRQDYPTIFDWMAMGYKPHSPYPGKITFFWSSSQTFRYGWRHIEQMNDAALYFVPGDHITCRTDHLPILAECLKECMQKFQDETREGENKV